MAEKLKSPPPDRNPKTPKLKAPPGATDTHFHLYGPQLRFPFNPNSPLDVEDSTLDDMLHLHNTLGIERGVIVQSVVQGNCYEYMIHALSREPDRLRGIALPAPDITDKELEILTTAGVVGSRFAYRASPEINMDIIHRTHEFGWHPQFWFRGPDEAAAWRDQMLSVPGNFVIDHMGWQPALGKGTDIKRMNSGCARTGIDLGLDGINAKIRERNPFTPANNRNVFDQPFPGFLGLPALRGF